MAEPNSFRTRDGFFLKSVELVRIYSGIRVRSMERVDDKHEGNKIEFRRGASRHLPLT